LKERFAATAQVFFLSGVVFSVGVLSAPVPGRWPPTHRQISSDKSRETDNRALWAFIKNRMHPFFAVDEHASLRKKCSQR
jgi:hypothetical protein